MYLILTRSILLIIFYYLVTFEENMKNILIILFSVCFVFSGEKNSINTIVSSGNQLIKLTSLNNHLDLKRKKDIDHLKKKDISTEKRRHKRRRKVRPPKQGK